ncbi:MAG: urease accessory protein UreE [Hyphomicrobiales bacterium]|nr:MAG: urease accessory protein UreE [Hyphomicrobiales bacterium]
MGETLRAVTYVPRGTASGFDSAVLLHDERRVRRRVIPLLHGDEVLVDFRNPVTLDQHGLLQLEDGRYVEIIAGEEQLYDIRGRDPKHLMQLAWHIGNRHAKAQIDGDRILILRDHVLRDMLIGLGATVTDISEPFSPMDGAYAHDHGHALLNR